MATLFVALECCRCSTMQVKQQRKSGSKWVCAICNQRQSMRRIHARGSVARDLRKFVQHFNMDRAGFMSDDSGAWSDAGGARDDGASSCGSPLPSARKRRDWSEYLDPRDNEKEQDGSMEGEAVTELPCAKRHRAESLNGKRRFGIMPAFAKREKLPSGGGDQGEADCNAESRRMMQESKGCSSTKWSEYLEVEEEGDARESLRPGGGGLLEPDYFHHDAASQGVAVEEDVHPDFM